MGAEVLLGRRLHRHTRAGRLHIGAPVGGFGRSALPRPRPVPRQHRTRTALGHPDQWQALKRGDAGVDTAVEEILRWTIPALHSGRTATADTEIAGRPIRAGDIVTVWNASANRDEQVFGDPGRLRLDHTPDQHRTFAHGPHFCLGAYLARAEIGAVLEGLRDRVQTLEQTGPARPVYSNFLERPVQAATGPEVRFTRRASPVPSRTGPDGAGARERAGQGRAPPRQSGLRRP
ncbi:cytochrome P450 [Streptomyces sp. NPDC008196]|uniref:cytochrome P450 n=1 Tax=Streptomyces sp. NPDC008196 TaxID=3364819 RepID=UPI0036E41CB6